MKKLILAVFLAVLFTACGAVYNTQLKQVELGMTRQDIVYLMGDKYATSGTKTIQGKTYEVLEYKDKYKNHFFFEFENNKLYKWYKEKEN